MAKKKETPILTPTPEQIINKHRAEETMILAKSMIRHKEQEEDDFRMREIQVIIATAQMLTKKE